ncbi:hypothetical protein Efla_007866 [Eimeria flavescens]
MSASPAHSEAPAAACPPTAAAAADAASDRQQQQQRQQEQKQQQQQQQPLLALEWKQFDFKYDGDFRVAGLPVLLPSCGGCPPRAPHQQEFGDTGMKAISLPLFSPLLDSWRQADSALLFRCMHAEYVSFRLKVFFS